MSYRHRNWTATGFTFASWPLPRRYAIAVAVAIALVGAWLLG